MGLQMHTTSLYFSRLLYTKGGEEDGSGQSPFKATCTSHSKFCFFFAYLICPSVSRLKALKVSAISLVRFQ